MIEELGLQEILVGVGVFAILAIVLDGIRRHRRQKNPDIRMDLDLTGSVSGDPFNPELPAGGARQAGGPIGLASQPTQLKSGGREEGVVDQAEAAFSLSPRFGDANAEQQFGVGAPAVGMPNFAASDGVQDTNKGLSSVRKSSSAEFGSSPSPLTPSITNAPGAVRPINASGRRAFDGIGEGPGANAVGGQSKPSIVPSATGSNKNTSDIQRSNGESTDGQSKTNQTPTDVLGVTVQAKADQSFSGSNLMQRFIEAGLRFGQHEVFHLYDVDSGFQETSLISVTNAREPRTFDLANMADLSTTAITLYMPLPVPGEPDAAFGRFLTLADQLAKGLDAQLCDLYQKPLTQATLANMHQRLLKVCDSVAQNEQQAEKAVVSDSQSDDAIYRERIAVTD